jgi:hypothetical protein
MPNIVSIASIKLDYPGNIPLTPNKSLAAACKASVALEVWVYSNNAGKTLFPNLTFSVDFILPPLAVIPNF